MEGFIYLIESLKNQKRYLGSTNNPVSRIKNHNSDNTLSTKFDKPWRFILIINVGEIDIAREIEKYIKNHKERLTVKNVIKIINRYYKLQEGI